MSYYKTLLRYPGGKSRAYKLISNKIPKLPYPDKIVSTFLGGGSMEARWALMLMVLAEDCIPQWACQSTMIPLTTNYYEINCMITKVHLFFPTMIVRLSESGTRISGRSSQYGITHSTRGKKKNHMKSSF